MSRSTVHVQRVYCLTKPTDFYQVQQYRNRNPQTIVDFVDSQYGGSSDRCFSVVLFDTYIPQLTVVDSYSGDCTCKGEVCHHVQVVSGSFVFYGSFLSVPQFCEFGDGR